MRTRTHSKTTATYWRDRIYKPPGRPDYLAQVQYQGRRHKFALGLSDSDLAARKAGMIYTSLMTEGWETTLATYAPAYSPVSTKPLTVGEFLKAADAVTTVADRTWADYKRSFRRIVADLEGISDEITITRTLKSGKRDRKVREIRSTKFDYRKGGRNAWVAQIDQVPLSAITSARIEQWMKAYVTNRAAGDPSVERSARNSANSMVRQASSLFSKAVLKRITVDTELPNSPFEEVRRFPRQSTRYNSRFDAIKLLQKAQRELLAAKPESFKILMLGLTAGLRRKEIDNLLWSQVDTESAQIRVEATAYFKPKSEDSIGVVDLDPEVAVLLKKFHETASGPFVIESHLDAKPNAKYSRVRCVSAFKDLYDWLRENGVQDLKPAHVLRKEFGSLVCEKHGLYEASRALRHADIQTTAQHYLDKKGKRTVGLGGALLSDAV